MARMMLRSKLTQDRQHVVLELLKEDQLIGNIQYDAASLEAVVQQLAACREALADPVSPRLEPVARLNSTQICPAWRIPTNHSGPQGTLLLALRHPGFGWLGFILDEARARKMGKLLIETPVSIAK